MKAGSYDLMNLGILPSGANITPGRIGIADESAFAETFLSKPLTDYAIGWKEDKLEVLLNFIAPPVRTAHRFEYRVVTKNGNAFAMTESDERALYGEFKIVNLPGDVIPDKTISKGLTTVIEKDSEIEGDREAKVALLKRMLLRAEIYRAIALLESGATNSAKTWASTATPDIDVLTAIGSFGDATGIDANRVLYGATAWQKRIGTYAAQDTKNFVPPATLPALAEFLGIDGAMKSSERYQSSSSSKSKIVTTNKVYIFMGHDGASKDDDSTMKRFWTPEQGGGEFATYIDDVTSPKLVKITVCHTSKISKTISTGVQTLTIS